MKIEKIDLINEENIYLTTLNEKASFFRGRIVDSCISVEMRLADILTDFFNQDAIKRQFMYSSIFTNSELSFSSKAKILSELITNFFPDVLGMFPDVVDDLRSTINLRTRIDHSMLDTSEEFTKNRYSDRIQLVYFIDGKRQLMTLTDDEFNVCMRKASKIIIALDHLKEKLNLN